MHELETVLLTVRYEMVEMVCAGGVEPEARPELKELYREEFDALRRPRLMQWRELPDARNGGGHGTGAGIRRRHSANDDVQCRKCQETALL